MRRLGPGAPVIPVVVVGALLIGFLALSTPATAFEPAPDCGDKTETGVLYTADSGLAVTDETGTIPTAEVFPDASTIQLGPVAFSAAGPASLQLSAVSDSSLCLRDLNATATGVHTRLDSGSSLYVEGHVQTIEFGPVDFNPDSDAADLAYRADSSFTVRVTGPVLPADTTVDAVMAGSDQRLASGTIGANGTLALTLPAGEQAVNLRLPPPPPPGADPPAIGVSSPVLNFGSVAVGSTSTLNVTIENLATTQQELRIDSTHVTGEDPTAFAVITGGAPFTLGPGETRELEVAFTPTSAGTKDAQLQIVSEAGRSQIDVWLTNTRTYVVVQEVGNRQAAGRSNATTVNIEGVNVDRNARISVNLTRPTLVNRSASIERFELALTRGGNFSMNVTHAPEPVRPNHATYSDAEQVPLQYLHIQHSAPESAFDGTTLVIRVAKQALPSSVGPADIELLRYEAGNWTAQPVRNSEETADTFLLTVDTAGFSQFVVVGPQPTEEPGGRLPGDMTAPAGGNTSGLLPVRLPDLPGDPGPAEAAAAGTTLSLGWALRPFLGDIIATFLIYFERSYRVGDLIEWGHQGVTIAALPEPDDRSANRNQGVVEDIGYRSTLIRAPDDSELSVPNAVLADAVVATAGTDRPMRLLLDIPVDLRADLERAKETILQITAVHEAVLREPPPEVYVRDFAEGRVNLQLQLWIAAEDVPDRFEIQNAVATAVKDSLADASLPFEYPSRHLWDGTE